MPKEVDHEERRELIGRAVLRILARSGPKGLTIRAVARELGGSPSLVTHYYPSRKALFAGMAAYLHHEWTEESAEIQAATEPGRNRLLATLIWMLPIGEEARIEETAALSMATAPAEEREAAQALTATEEWMRRLIRESLEGLVDSECHEATVDQLRVVVSGLTSEALRSPQDWPDERVITVLRQFLERLALLPEGEAVLDARAPADRVSLR